MPLLDLPNEIFIQAIEHLPKQRDINSVARTNRHLYSIFNDYVYLRNVQTRNGDALLWAAYYNREYTARRLLQFGANVNIRTKENPMGRCTITFHKHVRTGAKYFQKDASALHIAAWRGHSNIVQLLLEAGADAYALLNNRWTSRWSPLYVALVWRHEKIACMIAKYIPHLNICWDFVYGDERFKVGSKWPLHDACKFALPSVVRLFIDTLIDPDGEDVEEGKIGINTTNDWHGTPLFYALRAGIPEGRGVHLANGDFPQPSPDEALDTVKILLESGADPDIEIYRGGEDLTDPYSMFTWPTLRLRTLGRTHKDSRIRDLFLSDDELEEISCPIQIGRPWMEPVDPEECEMGLGSEDDQFWQRPWSTTKRVDGNGRRIPTQNLSLTAGNTENNIDTDSFPTLGGSQPSTTVTAPKSKTWTGASNTRILAGLSIKDDSDDRFPPLGGTASKLVPVNNAWAKSKSSGDSLLVIEAAKNEVKKRSGRKGKGKGQWQPLRI